MLPQGALPQAMPVLIILEFSIGLKRKALLHGGMSARYEQEYKERINYRGTRTSRREFCSHHPSYTSNLPLITRKWKNSQWRTSSTRSLPPVWYHFWSQISESTSSGVKP